MVVIFHFQQYKWCYQLAFRRYFRRTGNFAIFLKLLGDGFCDNLLEKRLCDHSCWLVNFSLLKMMVRYYCFNKEDRRICIEIFSSEVMWPLKADVCAQTCTFLQSGRNLGEKNEKVKTDKKKKKRKKLWEFIFFHTIHLWKRGCVFSPF